MSNLQTLYPVYFARTRKDESTEDRDNFIAVNENNMNQDFDILYNAYAELLSAYNDLLSRIKILEAK